MILSFLAVLVGTLTTACSKSDGDALGLSSKGLVGCTQDSDCSPMGFCGADGFCQAECRVALDCGEEGAFVCLEYHCVPSCTEKSQCTEEQICHPKGYCSEPECEEDEDCFALSEDFECEGGLCIMPAVKLTDWECQYRTPEECNDYKWVDFCADRACLEHGWRYSCNPVGTCQDNKEVDLGEIDESKHASAYAGVWGAVLTTAVRNKGLPMVPYQDTVSTHLMLVRIQQEGEGFVTHSYLCNLWIDNFNADKDEINNSLARMQVPLAYIRNVAILEHRVEQAPEMAPGAIMETSRFWEARGIKLDDIENEELCTMKKIDDGHPDCDKVWDQDLDGKFSMTTNMTGLLEAEIYSNQKWSSQFNLEVIDENHLMSIADTTNAQFQLGGVPDTMVAPSFTTQAHVDADRSYFRLKRLDEAATCADVLEEAGMQLTGTGETEAIPEEWYRYLRFTMHLQGPWTDPDSEEKFYLEDKPWEKD